MNEYRKSIPLSTETQYWFVQMGPVPNKPDWHTELYTSQSYPFPTPEAASLFASVHKRKDPLRDVGIRHPDGAIVAVA